MAPLVANNPATEITFASMIQQSLVASTITLMTNTITSHACCSTAGPPTTTVRYQSMCLPRLASVTANHIFEVAGDPTLE
ncbi:MAG: hypothetical protein M3299_18135 [Thermoproteota archaeon]|nr:hypothetical protein [Thermoproteota archaeon]